MPEIYIDKSVSHLQSAVLCVIVDIGGLRRDNTTVIPMPQLPQYTPSPVQTSRPTKKWLRRNGTSHVPYNNITPPELDKHFVNVIHKDLTLPIDKILRKRRSG
jgi:hypothetical protein